MKPVYFISVLLAICLLLSSCGFFSVNFFDDLADETTAEDTTAAETEPEPELYEPNYDTKINKYLKDLSGNTYEGAVRIAIAGTNVIMPDENTSKVLSDEWYERNASVESKLGLTISVSTFEIESLTTELKASTMSGTYHSDLLMIPQTRLGAYYTDGLLCNLRSLPGFDMDVEYLYPSATSAGMGGNSVFAVSGYASLTADSLGCVYYNRVLMSSVTEENIYDLVKSGEWTVDKFISLSSSVDSGVYGYSSGYVDTYLWDLFFFGAGGSFVSSELNKYPAAVISNESNTARVNAVKNLYNTNHLQSGGDNAVDIFTYGQSLFLVDKLSQMKKLLNTSVEWGILPLPKYDAQQEGYYSLADASETMFFAVPPTATDYEKSADLLSALNILSYGYNCDAYVNDASYYYLRDEGSIKTVSEILNSPVFDLSYSFVNSDYSVIGNSTYNALRNNIISDDSIADAVAGNEYYFSTICQYIFTVNN